MNEVKEIDTGVILPDDGVVDVKWALAQLERVDAFSKELMYFGKGSVLFMLSTNLTIQAYEQAVHELGYTVETSELYISYLQKREVLEAVKAKYMVAMSLSASEYLTQDVEDSLALCDVCIAKYGKLTADNLKKATEDTGRTVKKMSTATLNIETLKKKALMDWLADEYSMSDDDVHQASSINTVGKTEYVEKMLQAHSMLGDWKIFYDIIAETVFESDNPAALRFLADMQDASGPIKEYLDSEEAYNNLAALKDKFESVIYPELQFKQEQGDE